MAGGTISDQKSTILSVRRTSFSTREPDHLYCGGGEIDSKSDAITVAPQWNRSAVDNVGRAVVTPWHPEPHVRFRWRRAVVEDEHDDIVAGLHVAHFQWR